MYLLDKTFLLHYTRTVADMSQPLSEAWKARRLADSGPRRART